MSDTVLQLDTASYLLGSRGTAVAGQNSILKKTNSTGDLVTNEYQPSERIALINRIPSSSSLSPSMPQSLSSMNSQLTLNDPTSNLHLLSKVIEATECDTMMAQEQQRVVATAAPTTVAVNPKRVSLPLPNFNKSDRKAIQSNETPTTRVTEDDKIIRSTKSWKKKAIIAMEKEETSTTPTPPVASKNSDHPADHGTETATMDMTMIGNSSHSISGNSLLNAMTLLPETFQPGPFDVLCGRGRTCKDAPGNKAYREIIMNHLQVYAASTTKLAKGQIISNIMDQIKQQCYEYHRDKIGGFVKQSNGRWYDVGEFLAREKTSQCFRDALAALYSSSAQSKYLRRRASKEITTNDNVVKHQIDVLTQSSHRPSLPLGKRYKAINVHESFISFLSDLFVSQHSEDSFAINLDTEASNSMHHPVKKVRLHSPEETAIDALQQMATFSSENGVNINRPPSCSPSPDTSPKLMSNPSSATASGTSSTVMTSFDCSNNLSAPSTIQSVSKQFESRPVIFPRRESHHSTQAGNATMDLRSSPVFVCALQVALRPPNESPWDALLRVESQMESIAASDTVDVFVLPELAPIGYSEDTFSKYLPINPANQAMYQEFDRFFQVAARKFNSYICYGTVGWSYDNRNMTMIRLGLPRLFIRQIVVDRLGTQVACYDKTYLCNYGECAESRYFQPGPASTPTSFAVYSRDRSSMYRFGLLLCSDMRYPNLARTLTSDPEHCVDCILQPCAFVRDCSFRTWSSFRETRAVENSIFWIGINYSGTNYGETSIIPPFVDDDHLPISLECEEGFVIGRVARSTLDHARTQFPFYRNLMMEGSMKFRN